MEAIGIRLETIATGWRPLLLVTRNYWVEAIAIRLEAIATNVETNTTSNEKLLVII